MRVAQAYRPRHRLPLQSGMFRTNIDVVSSSASMAGTTVVTSGLGFLYWLVAARSFDTSVVGGATAAVTVLTLLGTLGMFGLGTLLIAEVASAAGRPGALISTSLAVASAASAVMATIFLLLVPLVSPSLGELLESPLTGLMLVVGVSLTAVALVLDQVLIGLRLSYLQMWRNAYFAAVKLVLLGALALFPWTNMAVEQLLCTWLLGLAASLVLVGVHLRARDVLIFGRPQYSTLRGLGRTALYHNVLNLAVTVPRMAFPLVVAFAVPGAATAVFFSAWMVAGFLYVIPAHLSLSLFAISSGDPATLQRKLRFTSLLSYCVGGPASALLALLAVPVMGLFGSDYVLDGGMCLAILALSYTPSVVKQQYVAVSRLTKKSASASLTLSLAAGAELTAGWFGARHYGIVGAAAALAAVMLLESIVMGPRVFMAAKGSSGHLQGLGQTVHLVSHVTLYQSEWASLSLRCHRKRKATEPGWSERGQPYVPTRST